MSISKLILATSFLLVAVLACRRERSVENSKFVDIDTLPSNYPFATGYCKEGGTSLGITITDTSDYHPDTTLPLPAAVLLEMPFAGDQGGQGSCTAWATVYGLGNYYHHLRSGKAYSDTGNLSPKFTYNQIARGTCSCTSILDNLYLLKTQGACSLGAMPYDPTECLLQPNDSQKRQGVRYKINGWQKVDLHKVDLIKRALAAKNPVSIAIRVDEGFRSLSAPYTWKERAGALGEGHAMVITGYDDQRAAFRIMNSWGTAWGDKGFAWIDYSFFSSQVMEGGYIVF